MQRGEAFIHAKSVNGWTALLLASLHGHLLVVQLKTLPLQHAIIENVANEEIIKYYQEKAPAQALFNALIKKGITINTIKQLPEYQTLIQELSNPFIPLATLFSEAFLFNLLINYCLIEFKQWRLVLKLCKDLGIEPSVNNLTLIQSLRTSNQENVAINDSPCENVYDHLARIRPRPSLFFNQASLSSAFPDLEYETDEEPATKRIAPSRNDIVI